MTDQPTQDAIVSQRARDLTQAILDCWFNRSVIEAKIEAFQAEIEAATIERCVNHAKCAFDDRPNSRSGHHSEMDWTDGYRDGTRAAESAIRNLKGQTS